MSALLNISLLIIVIAINKFIWYKEREEKMPRKAPIFCGRDDMWIFVNIHKFSLTN